MKSNSANFIFSRKNSLLILVIFILCSGCRKDEQEPVITHETGTMTDVEGNVYRTVKIGNQWWMAENLKVKKYRNGFLIPEISGSEEWKNDTTGACCAYDNSPDNPELYGLLYNWMAVSGSANLAPEGWHIPSDEEWKQLERQVGMNETEVERAGWRGTEEGDKLKVSGTEGWSSHANVWATNESGFSAIGGGCRLFNGITGQPGLKQTGFWWTSSAVDSLASYRYLDYKNTTVFRGAVSGKYGFSVRCVRD